YTHARSEDTESKYPEIVKNIALIYNELGQKDKAMKAVQDARKANPGDVGLILTEANIYIQLGEKQRYKELIEEALEKDPNNAVLYFNLGVVNSEQGDRALAREYYEKAIEVDPSMENAYLNLVALILENESTIVEQMNNLGNSRADNQKYDELKKEREKLYKECVPVLKQLIALDDSNLEAVQTLRNIYGTIGDNEGFMEMKAIMEKYEKQ
ncbi:MAG: tetratricopeptide repeat protein, partial [Flavobacteriaceae bacterium]